MHIEEIYEYRENRLFKKFSYRTIKNDNSINGNISCTYYFYNDEGKIKTEDYVKYCIVNDQMKNIRRDSLEYFFYKGFSYRATNISNNKYNYFNNGYGIVYSMLDDIFSIDTFFLNNNQQVVKHMKYINNECVQNEVYYFGINNRIEKVVANCVINDETLYKIGKGSKINKMVFTYVYEWE